VLFSSGATDLVSGDTNGKWDVFLRDTVAHTTVRVSLGDHGAQLPGQNFGMSMTPNANLIVFGYGSVFLRDRATGTTRRISGRGFQQGAFDGVISANGRYVAFTGDPVLGPGNLYRRDLKTNTVVSRGNLNIEGVTGISADGNRIVFARQDENNGNFIVNTFIWQVTPNSLITVSHVTTPNTYSMDAGGISADGRYVTFATDSPSEVAGDTNAAMDVFRRDTQTGTTIRISVSAGGGQLADPSAGGSITSDGSMVVFTTLDSSVVAGDTNQHRDVFLRGPLP
jgi:Tol biopolymer transport system component